MGRRNSRRKQKTDANIPKNKMKKTFYKRRNEDRLKRQNASLKNKPKSYRMSLPYFDESLFGITSATLAFPKPEIPDPNYIPIPTIIKFLEELEAEGNNTGKGKTKYKAYRSAENPSKPAQSSTTSKIKDLEDMESEEERASEENEGQVRRDAQTHTNGVGTSRAVLFPCHFDQGSYTETPMTVLVNRSVVI